MTNGAGYITGIDSGAVTTALGFTPENAANKNAVNGYAGLDAGGKVAAAQLPSYVDDVLESASFASLPATGETGKIYITLDTNKVYRWGGSAYVEIVASPGSTDEVTEGATNLYFTQQRARDSFSAGANISLTNGEIAVTGSLGMSDIVEDTTPQLGGDLDVNGNSIVDSVNGTINIGGFAYPNNITEVQSGTVVAIQAQDRLTLNDTGANLGLANNDTLQFTGSDVGQFDGSSPIGLEAGVTYYINFPFGTSFGHISLGTLPVGDPNRQTVLTNMNTGYTITDLQWQQVQEVLPGNTQVLAWNGTQLAFADQPAAGITTVVEDTTPQLGGNLDANSNIIQNLSGITATPSNPNINLNPYFASKVIVNGNFETTGNIVSSSNGNITLAPDGTGASSISNLQYQEKVHALGTTSGTVAPNVSNGNVQTITLNGNLTLNAFTSPQTGQSVTLIVKQDATGSRTLTSSMLFAGGEKTLTTDANSVDIISVFYDGTNYYASLSTNFS